jgi:hypothetical protein
MKRGVDGSCSAITLRTRATSLCSSYLTHKRTHTRTRGEDDDDDEEKEEEGVSGDSVWREETVNCAENGAAATVCCFCC